MGPLERVVARAVLLDRRDRILLIHIRDDRAAKDLWITPGGGLEPGEDDHDALVRELQEETGLVITRDDIGPHLWRRTDHFVWDGVSVRQQENFYLVRIEAHEPQWSVGGDVRETAYFRDHRWWRLADLAAETDRTIVPRALATLLAALLENGPPAEPVDCGR